MRGRLPGSLAFTAAMVIAMAVTTAVTVAVIGDAAPPRHALKAAHSWYATQCGPARDRVTGC